MINIDRLSFSYGKLPVLSNISMDLQEGRIYGLLGGNGVGKTTLLTLLAGLKKPLGGEILVDGLHPYDRLPSCLEQQYFLPDSLDALPMKAKSFAGNFGKFWNNFSMDVFLEAMRDFDVDAELRMDRMSFGQLKKCYVSFAFACGCKYLFMDEPTNGLDIPSKAQFRKALMKYTSEESTVVISTHQVRDLENVIDPIIILDGRDVLVNASLAEISSKFFFDYSNIVLPHSLYSEMIPGGCIQVMLNADGAESKVNIEAFFNAVISNKELVKSLLGQDANDIKE
ncbi:MAG: ATP-binding cassette domain-containing protein [Bacteroidales bacterium]|nr:ATP-binding cassette domain-containing protein [Bacteroidales bacterium]